MTSTATPIDPDLDAVATKHGWTITRVGNVGALYTRGTDTLRVNYTTSRAARRVIREVEHEWPAPAGQEPFYAYAGSATPGKRPLAVGILMANFDDEATASDAEPVAAEPVAAEPIAAEPAEPIKDELTAHVTMHRGMGPFYLRETLASAEHDGYHLEWTRIIPMGLHLAVRKDDETVRVVVLNEKALMEAMATLALGDLK